MSRYKNETILSFFFRIYMISRIFSIQNFNKKYRFLITMDLKIILNYSSNCVGLLGMLCLRMSNSKSWRMLETPPGSAMSPLLVAHFLKYNEQLKNLNSTLPYPDPYYTVVVCVKTINLTAMNTLTFSFKGA